MRRLHLFEFNDQPWFPQTLRDAETAYLTVAYRTLPLPRRWAEKISAVLNRGEPAEILDLCSGSGGAVPLILDELKLRGYDVKAKLTDLYPNLKSTFHPSASWIAAPVDATRVSPKLTGVRTMFSAFHHFPPHSARAILKDAFDLRRPICIFESGSGTLLGAAAIIAVPLVVLFFMPFARPFRWAYLAFTYLLPVVPLILLWDGMVSMLRVYSPQQMRELTAGLDAPDYVWEIGRMKVRGSPGALPYLIGQPSPPQTQPS